MSEWGDEFRRKADEIESAFNALMEEMLERTLQRAEELSSLPPIPPGEHPFARSHGAPQMDPSEIHTVTGRFAAAWQGYVENGERIRVWNDAPEAEYLQQGTETMFARPLWERVEQEIGEELQQKASDVIARLT